jgi:peptidoglycan L-alanyl-D-glutamate endopeptidase CwlK
VHPDLVRVVERAIQITTQDFRVQKGLRTRERQGALVARGARVPVCWGGCWDSLLAIASPEDSVADYVATCRATGQKPFVDGPHFELSRSCRHDRPDQDSAGHRRDRRRRLRDGGRLVGTSACRASCSRPSWHRFTAGSRLLEPFDRDTRLLVLDQTLVECQSARHALAGDGCGVRDVGWWRGPPAAARRPVVVIAA